MLTLDLDDKIAKMEEEDNNDAFFLITALALMGKHSSIQSIQTYLPCEDLPGHPRFCRAWTDFERLETIKTSLPSWGLILLLLN
jgi:hypothetical protein